MTSSGDPGHSIQTTDAQANARDQTRHTHDEAELVHEARKTIKRMRAMAQLLRYELGEDEFQRVSGRLRTAGRRLAGARDAQVRLATLDALTAHHPKALGRPGARLLRERLERERDEAGEPAPQREALEQAHALGEELGAWSRLGRDFATVAPGLRRIYGEGRRRYRRVRRDRARDPETVHEWRKRVKSLHYALDALGATSAKGSRGLTRRTGRLGDVLGEKHDLWLLATYVEDRPDALGEDALAREELLRLTARRRKRLSRRALRIGARLYEREPADFTRRVGRALPR